MNRKGFTLIEILAAIVILGIVSAIGIAAVSNNIVETRKSTFLNLARQLANSAREMRGADKLPKDLKDGEALVIPCYSLNGNEIDLSAGTGFGDLLLDYCYVGIVNNKNKYEYYVTAIDSANYGYVALEVDELSKDNLSNDNDLVAGTNLMPTSGTLSAFKVTYNGTQYNIKAARIKEVTTNGVSLTAYYSNNSSTNSSSKVNGTLVDYDNFLGSSTQTVVGTDGVTYTIKEHEVMYLFLSKNV